MTAPVPDAPFHRLARTESYRWWRPLLELLLVAVFLLVLELAVTRLMTVISGLNDHDLGHAEGGIGLAYIALMIAAFILAAMLGAYVGGRRQPGALLSIRGRLRWRWFARCLLAGFAVHVIFQVALAVIYARSPASASDVGFPGWTSFLPLAATIVVAVPLQCAGEELIFRGTLLQAIGAWIATPWVGIVITGVLFAVLHGLHVLTLIAIGWSGIVWAWLAIRTGGLEAPIAMHAANNVTAFLITAITGGSSTWRAELNVHLDWLVTVLHCIVQLIIALIIARMSSRNRS